MENDVYGTCIGLEYKHELNLKQKMHKGSSIKLRKLYDTKARNNKINKSTTRSDDNYGKTTKTKLVWIQKGKYSNI